MPVVKIDILPLEKDVKRDVIVKVTELLSEITKKPKESFTIIINEHDPESMGVAGVPLSERKK